MRFGLQLAAWALTIGGIDSWAQAKPSEMKTQSSGEKVKTTVRVPAKARIWTKDEGDWMDVPVFPAGAKMKVASGDPSSPGRLTSPLTP